METFFIVAMLTMIPAFFIIAMVGSAGQSLFRSRSRSLTLEELHELSMSVQRMNEKKRKEWEEIREQIRIEVEAAEKAEKEKSMQGKVV